MAKRKQRNFLLGIVLVLIIALCGVIGSNFYFAKQKANENIKTNDAEESLVLNEVSQRTGIEFHEWSPLREYVYCQLLNEGMPRKEVEKALTNIGEIQPFLNFSNKETVTFKNRYLYSYLSPIILKFDSGGSSGDLIEWRRSYEHIIPIPLASCEEKIIKN